MMALEHASSGQVIEVLRRDGGDLSQFSAIALARTDELELIRMCMPKGKTMPEHHVLGEITLLCLQGQVAVTAPSCSVSSGGSSSISTRMRLAASAASSGVLAATTATGSPR